MNEVNMNVLEIDGKDFLLVETVGKYNFFVELNNYDNICILKEVVENDEIVFVNLEEDEVDEALGLYYEKLKNANQVYKLSQYFLV